MEITKIVRTPRILSNLSIPKKSAKVMLMIKADAYGHGIVEVAKALENEVDFFGVATLEEGRIVRENGVKTPILATDMLPFEFSEAKALDLSVSVGDMKALYGLAAMQERAPKVHLKINTGMNRFGFSVEEVDDVLSVAESIGVEVEGIYTHLYAPNDIQLDLFDGVVERVKKRFPNVVTHACSSSSVNLNRYDMVRIGLSAYLGAAEIESVVLSSQKVAKGERIGYGDNFSDEDCYAVWLLGGYADGIVKGQPVLIDGELYEGASVCMDVFAVKSSRPFERGERVILANDSLPINEVASKTNRTIYETMTALSGRVKRIYDESRG